DDLKAKVGDLPKPLTSNPLDPDKPGERDTLLTRQATLQVPTPPAPHSKGIFNQDIPPTQDEMDAQAATEKQRVADLKKVNDQLGADNAVRETKQQFRQAQQALNKSKAEPAGAVIARYKNGTGSPVNLAGDSPPGDETQDGAL